MTLDLPLALQIIWSNASFPASFLASENSPEQVGFKNFSVVPG